MARTTSDPQIIHHYAPAPGTPDLSTVTAFFSFFPALICARNACMHPQKKSAEGSEDQGTSAIRSRHLSCEDRTQGVHQREQSACIGPCDKRSCRTISCMPCTCAMLVSGHTERRLVLVQRAARLHRMRTSFNETNSVQKSKGNRN